MSYLHFKVWLGSIIRRFLEWKVKDLTFILISDVILSVPIICYACLKPTHLCARVSYISVKRLQLMKNFRSCWQTQYCNYIS